MRILWVSALVVAGDQLSKYVIKANLSLHSPVPVLGDFFRLTFVENSGIAFGIKIGTALPLFTGLSLLAVGIITYYLYQARSSHVAVQTALALILGGAIGNIIDRITYGRVVDFLDFGIGTYRFYIFNLADSAVTVGVGLYLLMSFLLPQESQEAEIEAGQGME